MEAAVAALHRFPVKGLSPEPLGSARLSAGGYFPGDRLFAVENGPSGFDEAAPAHLPKSAFLMLMRNARLARLRSRFSDEDGHLTIALEDQTMCQGDLRTEAGRQEVERFLSGFCAGEVRGAVRVRHASPAFRFTDSKDGFVSLLNLASVTELAAAIGRPVDPLRFRANIALDGLPAWVENDWVGRELRVGGCVLAVTALTDRCAATEVDPATGARDMAVVKALVKGFGHNVCGVYARVVQGGVVRGGDAVSLVG